MVLLLYVKKQAWINLQIETSISYASLGSKHSKESLRKEKLAGNG